MDFKLQSELDEVESEMIQEDVREWSAYKREKRREENERMAIVVVTGAFFVFAVVVVVSFIRAQLGGV
jgi:hypothetical protein